jgi:hypothetical protein
MGMCNSSNTKKFETKDKIKNFPPPKQNFVYNNNKLNENYYLKTDNNNLTNKNN